MGRTWTCAGTGEEMTLDGGCRRAKCCDGCCGIPSIVVANSDRMLSGTCSMWLDMSHLDTCEVCAQRHDDGKMLAGRPVDHGDTYTAVHGPGEPWELVANDLPMSDA